jgi:hypothetical protein
MLIKNSRALEGQKRQKIYAGMRERQWSSQGQNLGLSWPQYRRKSLVQRKQLESSNITTGIGINPTDEMEL